MMGPAAKWDVDEPVGTYTTYEGIYKVFLSFFQLPIQHDIGLELLTGLGQSTVTHITNHIHEWWSICKIDVIFFLLD